MPGAGIVLGALSSKLMKGFLFEVKPLDAWTYFIVMIALLAVGALASFVPARRAAAVEPIEALRDE